MEAQRRRDEIDEWRLSGISVRLAHPARADGRDDFVMRNVCALFKFHIPCRENDLLIPRIKFQKVLASA
jgi:hypothetical protein